MGEVLSQSEIDALLSALTSGELQIDEPSIEEKQKVKKYDFKRPNKFSKDHIRTLEMVHDNFGRISANYLTANLRTSVQIKVISTEQITFEEFIHSIPNPTILMTFYLEPFPGIFMFETGPSFVFEVIDLLFGGSGKGHIKTRDFTEIEKNIVKKINTTLLENLKLAWEDIIHVEFKFDNLETNPVLNQVMAPNEPVCLITFSVQIGNSQSYMNMCIPYISIEKYIDKFVVQYKSTTADVNDANEQNQVRKNILPVTTQCYVELGKTNITIEEFLNLSVGDVVKLDKNTKEPLDFYVEDRLHFKVYPGIIGKKLGVQVYEIIGKDVEDDA
ncbi:Flagellar motor switch protein FliM [Caloramator mitchellensis]|uniref:Flagellar motor switch protein FliM n=1 Tax=Caloramator mitchellensis TaxID=908809 RepID=A0A0R3JRC6_CALMK|nr:flagellar motor switch protein FliM [Caloramator mitchellensis]KRQ85993.1 Flagellar motor switch protein FliM [Caloramator mitchellensis]